MKSPTQSRRWRRCPGRLRIILTWIDAQSIVEANNLGIGNVGNIFCQGGDKWYVVPSLSLPLPSVTMRTNLELDSTGFMDADGWKFC